MTQGSSLDEVVHNLREVVGLALEGEDLARRGSPEKLEPFFYSD